MLAWTGKEAIAWSAVASRDYPDTALYDPVTDRWRLAARSPYVAFADPDEPPRLLRTVDDHGHLWLSVVDTPALPPRLYEYAPEKDAWSTLEVPSLVAGLYSEIVSLDWVPLTREIVAVSRGGGDQWHVAAYRPEDGTFRTIAPPAAAGGPALFAGSRLWVCCQSEYDPTATLFGWNASTGDWLAHAGAPGIQMMASKPLVVNAQSNAWLAYLELPARVTYVSAWSGWLYDTAADSFTAIGQPDRDVMPFPGRMPTAWASDRALFLWGGTGDAVETGTAYDIAKREWRSMPLGGPRFGDGLAVWTGDVAVLFGGDMDTARYRP